MKQSIKTIKEVQMSIKMEPELRDQFMAAASSLHRPAAQIVRDLMRSFIVCQEMPNADTIAAIQAVERGEFMTHVSAADLYREFGI
jgi:predicted transcriptional regulator